MSHLCSYAPSSCGRCDATKVVARLYFMIRNLVEPRSACWWGHYCGYGQGCLCLWRDITPVPGATVLENVCLWWSRYCALGLGFLPGKSTVHISHHALSFCYLESMNASVENPSSQNSAGWLWGGMFLHSVKGMSMDGASVPDVEDGSRSIRCMWRTRQLVPSR